MIGLLIETSVGTVSLYIL